MADELLWEYHVTDLDLKADFDFGDLIDELTGLGLSGSHRHTGHFDLGPTFSPRFRETMQFDPGEEFLSRFDRHRMDFETEIDGLVTAVEGLSNSGREVWDRLLTRQFNAAVCAGTIFNGPAIGLSPSLLERLGQANGGLLITPYPTRCHSDYHEPDPRTFAA